MHLQTLLKSRVLFLFIRKNIYIFSKMVQCSISMVEGKEGLKFLMFAVHILHN